MIQNKSEIKEYFNIIFFMIIAPMILNIGAGRRNNIYADIDLQRANKFVSRREYHSTLSKI